LQLRRGFAWRERGLDESVARRAARTRRAIDHEDSTRAELGERALCLAIAMPDELRELAARRIDARSVVRGIVREDRGVRFEPHWQTRR
jgi:hypothetical protein